MNYFIKYFLFLLAPLFSGAQCDTIVFNTDSANISCNNTYTIKAINGYSSYYWNNGSTNDSLNVTSPGTYWCEVIINRMGSNLIYNGDFSLGDVGFTNSYTKSTGCFGNGNYDVRSSSLSCFSGAWRINNDHTGGVPGLFLLVNESSSGTYDWCQTVTTIPGRTYLFEGWFATLAWNPNFILEVNGTPVGSSGVIPNNSTWMNYGFTFVASSTTTNICLKSNGTASDIAIDDLSLYEVCSDKDTFEVLPSTYIYDTLIDSFCFGTNYNFNGNYLNTAGTYHDTILSSSCDTIKTLILSQLNIPITNDTIFKCDSLLSPSGRFTWYSTGIYYDTLLSSSGCDSVLHINLFIGGKYDTLSITACDSILSPSGNYVWKSSGQYFDTLLTYSGCDSIILINLFIGNTIDTLTISVCDSLISPSGLYNWHNTGIYMDTLITSGGCDSVLVINLNVEKSYSSISLTTCENLVSPSGNYIWTNSGIYLDTIINMNGCDSIITINLTVKKVNYDSVIISKCGPLFSSLSSKSWKISGIYTDTLKYPSGCDSLVVTYYYENLCEGGCPIYTPNAFTPDNDGDNDYFLPVINNDCSYENYIFYVFNRWGELVFNSNNLSEGWNGTHKGNPSPEGIYIWKIEYLNGVEKTMLHGHVSLLR